MRLADYRSRVVLDYLLAILTIFVLVISLAGPVEAQQAAWNGCRSAQTSPDKILACSQAISTLRDKGLLEKAYLRRGNAYLEQRQFGLAVADFTKLIALHPGVAGYYDNRQAAFKGLGNFQAALSDVNTAMNLAPKLAFPHLSRGLLLGSLDRWQEALSDFNASVAIEPSNPSFLNLRGEALVKLNRADEAIRDFNNALILDPKAIYVLKGRAQANAMLGNSQAALSDIQVFMQTYPTDPDAPGILAELQRTRNQAPVVTRASQPEIAGTKSVGNQVTKADVLATFCAPQDVDDNNCKVVRNYPGSDSSSTCNVELDGGVFEQRFQGEDVIFASYRSDCESHATNYGGSVLLQRSRGTLKFLSFVAGSPVGDNCVTVAGDYDQDTLYCISKYDGMGEHDSGLASYWPRRQNGSSVFNAIDTAEVISGSRYYDNDPVDCSKRIVYLDVDKVRPGPKPQTLLVDVKYADNDLIKAACSTGGYKPPDNNDPLAKGSVFLAPGQAKSEPFVYDVQSREFLPLRRYLDDAMPSKPAPAQSPVVATAAPINENRVALVIGNSEYKNVPALPNPQRDAEAVAEKLKALGFRTVTLVTNAGQAQMISALSEFSDVASQADWAVVYFAGHGLVVDGKNYLVPVDAALKSDRQVALQTISLDQMMGAISGAKKLRLVFLDACRDDPFLNQMMVTSAKRSLPRGLARVEPDSGTMVIYAARDGAVADDGQSGSHSPFTTALLDNIGAPGVEINLLLRKVRDDVLRATGNEQEPFTYGSLPGQEYYFAK